MNTIRADFSVSVTELKKNPANVFRTSGRQPVAVLSHNKPMFYMVHPEVYEKMLDMLEDVHWNEIALKRLATKDDVVMVNLDSI
jgi:antitoxin StbD